MLPAARPPPPSLGRPPARRPTWRRRACKGAKAGARAAELWGGKKGVRQARRPPSRPPECRKAPSVHSCFALSRPHRHPLSLPISLRLSFYISATRPIPSLAHCELRCANHPTSLAPPCRFAPALLSPKARARERACFCMRVRASVRVQ